MIRHPRSPLGAWRHHRQVGVELLVDYQRLGLIRLTDEDLVWTGDYSLGHFR
jgi:hypothetical protein